MTIVRSTDAAPDMGHVSASLTSDTWFAPCLHCRESVAQESRNKAWYHRYVVGSPIACPTQSAKHYGDRKGTA